MGKSRTARYQLGRSYMIDKEPWWVIATEGTPGNEIVTFEHTLWNKKLKRKQQYR